MRILIIIIFCWSQTFIPLSEALSQIEENQLAQDSLELAQEKYYNGEFDETIELVKQFLQQSNLTQEDLFSAYKILSQAYIAKNYIEPAKQIIVKLLEIEPAYTPTIEYEPPQFVSLVVQVKEEIKTEEAQASKATEVGDKTWLYITAGSVIVIGTVAILVLGKEDEAKPLPEPPGWPKEH
jgi:tetratricopeptide (TPR) repeat protein